MKELLLSIDPDCDVSSMHHKNVSMWIVDTFEAFKKRLIKFLKANGISSYYLATSVDGWTEDETLGQFDGFSIHFISKDWKLYCLKLPLFEVHASHTGIPSFSPAKQLIPHEIFSAEKIRASYDQAMREMGLHPAFVTSDTAANMQAAFPGDDGVQST